MVGAKEVLGASVSEQPPPGLSTSTVGEAGAANRITEVTVSSKTKAKAPQSDPFYDVAGCAEYLGQTERWVRRNVNEGKLPYVRMGRRLAFRRSALEKWIAEHVNAPQGQ